jgi:ATP-binding cassette subfamily B protein
VAYFAYVQALYQPLREMAEKWNLFLSGMTSAERIFSLSQWPQEEDTPENLRTSELHQKGIPQAAPKYEKAVLGEIRFDHVWFAYSGENWVLKDFSWTISPGQTVGIVGHTGAGKSTLTALLLRFYEAQKGTITIDGVDIRKISKRTLRQIFGVVQQEAFLFSGSVRDNVTLWRDLEHAEGVRETLQQLGRGHWWEESESVAAIELDERGSNLSAGERQILSFARALGQGPSIWILDEATAHIDSQTEKEMSRLVKNAFHGKTALIVAHRLATIREADEIIVLNRGELVESGNHEALMKLNGLYARLYRYQSASAFSISDAKV